MTFHTSLQRRHAQLLPGTAPFVPKGKCACGGTAGPCTACGGKAGSADAALAGAEAVRQAGELALAMLLPESAAADSAGRPQHGHDFSAVPVHDHAAPAAFADGFALASRAAGDPRRSPATGAGRNLLAQDLAGLVRRSAARAAAPAGNGGLSVSSPSDAAEVEADRISTGLFSGSEAASASRGEASFLRRPKVGGGPRRGRSESRQLFGGLADEGQALPERTRNEMESALGADLSGVRIHVDSNAGLLSRSLEARAFTHGSDIFFDTGQFAPEFGRRQAAARARTGAHPAASAVRRDALAAGRATDRAAMRQRESLRRRHSRLDADGDRRHVRTDRGACRKPDGPRRRRRRGLCRRALHRGHIGVLGRLHPGDHHRLRPGSELPQRGSEPTMTFQDKHRDWNRMT